MNRVALLAAGLLATSCQKDPLVLEHNGVWNGLLAQLVVDGKVVANEQDGHIEQVQSPNPDSSMVLRVVLPCGPHDFPVQVTQSESRRGKSTPKGSLRFPHSYEDYVTEIPSWVMLAIDNRGGAPTTVSLGAMTIKVPTGTFATHVPGPACPEGSELRLGSDSVAALELPTGKTTTVLVDVKGGRCYRQTELRYASADDMLGSMLGNGLPRLYFGRRAYDDDVTIDYFLTPPPKTIAARGFLGLPPPSVTHIELVDCSAEERTALGL